MIRPIPSTEKPATRNPSEQRTRSMRDRPKNNAQMFPGTGFSSLGVPNNINA
ncbi:MAG: hypothetical protein AAFY20_23825 [Cyanobacteria bacterium J06639_14]